MRVDAPQLFDGGYPYLRTAISAVSTLALLVALVCLVAVAI